MQVSGTVRQITPPRPLAGVCVSNGQSIVQTDAEGHYTLNLDPERHRFIFLSMPEGWRPKDSFYRSVCGWTKDRTGIDFNLESDPHRTQRNFKLAHITDTHLGHPLPVNKAMVATDLQQVVRDTKPDLLISSGDLTDWGLPHELEEFQDAAHTVATPLFTLFAGHDGNAERFGGLTAAEISKLKAAQQTDKLDKLIAQSVGNTFTHYYEQVLGPSYYSFDWGGRHFVLYPNEQPFFSNVDRQQKEDWLWSDLAIQPANRQIIVVVHIPPDNGFLDRLSQYNTRLVLHGHFHCRKIFSHDSIIVAAAPSLCFGGIDTSCRGYQLVRFGDDDLQLEPVSLTSPNTRLQSVNTPTPKEIPFGDHTLSLRWEHQMPTQLHRAAPVRCGHNLLLSLRDDAYPTQAGVYCVDTQTGKFLWHAPTDASINNSIAVSQSETDNLAAAMGVAVSVTGRVYGIELASGHVQWQSDLPDFPQRWIHTSPRIVDQNAYVGAKAGYAALDLASGTQKWYTELSRNDKWPCYASPAVYENLLIVHVPEGLTALDREDGTIVWQQRLKVGYPYGSPVVSGPLLINGGDVAELHQEYVHIDFSDGVLDVGRRSKLAVLQAQTGQIVWHQPVLRSRYPTGLMVHNDQIYLATPAGGIQSYDLHTGKFAWQFETGDDKLDMIPYRRGDRSVLAAPVNCGNRLLIAACDGCLYVLDPDSGNCISQTSFGEAISAAPALIEGGLCIATYGGKLFCFSRSHH